MRRFDVEGTGIERSHEPARVLDELARAVIGAALDVHRALGAELSENVYEEALAIELGIRGVSFERQHRVRLRYKGHDVGEGRVDLLVEQQLVVELKSVELLLAAHQAQVISYLKATGHHLGLLINFNVSQLRHGVRRVVLSPTLRRVAP